MLKLRAKTARVLDLGAAESAKEENLQFDSDDFVGVDKIVVAALLTQASVGSPLPLS